MFLEYGLLSNDLRKELLPSGRNQDESAHHISLQACYPAEYTRYVQKSIHVALLYDWKISCLLIGSICLHKSQRLPENRYKLAYKLILQVHMLKLVPRS